MKDATLMISPEERADMERIILDADAAAALALIGRFRERLAAREKQRMRPPLDR